MDLIPDQSIKKKSIRSKIWSGKPRIMLSGFNETEIRKYAAIIENNNAIYECDINRPQSFMPTATHLVSKVPNKCEKYLASIAAGIWVLQPSFLDFGIINEESHLWGLKISQQYSKSLQKAPMAWRQKISKTSEGPFFDWHVGLILEKNKIDSLKSIIIAGGGNVVFSISSASEVIEPELLLNITHVFSTPYLFHICEAYPQLLKCKSGILKAHSLTLWLTSEGKVNLKNYQITSSETTSHDELSSLPASQESSINSSLLNSLVKQDPKLTNAIPKIILYKDDISKIIEKDKARTTEQNEPCKVLIGDTETQINEELPCIIQKGIGLDDTKNIVPDDIITAFISNNSSFIQDTYDSLNHIYSPNGIIEESCICFLTTAKEDKTITSFTEDDLSILEGNLCLNKETLFLRRVGALINPNKYPSSEVIFILLNILLNSPNTRVTKQAYNCLRKILNHHPPQCIMIQELNLYQDSIKMFYNIPDSSLLRVARSLENLNFVDIKHTGNMTQLWHFYSHVFHFALKTLTEESYIDLLKILTFLLVENYQFVIDSLKINDFPQKSFIADLLWEKNKNNFVTQTCVLKDMINIFVLCSKKCCLKQHQSISLDTSQNIQSILDCICQIVYITTSWALYIDSLKSDDSGVTYLIDEIVSIFAQETYSIDYFCFEFIINQLPLYLKPKVIAKKLEDLCSTELIKNTSQAKQSINLVTIANYYMRLIPQFNDLQLNSSLPLNASKLQHGPCTTISKLVIKKVNKRNHKGETPLLIACRTGNIEAVKKLLDTPGIDATCPDFFGWTPLGEACNNGHVDCVRELLKLPIKSDLQKDNELGKLEVDLCACPLDPGDTPLHDVIENHNIEIAKLLLEKGGTKLLDQRNAVGKTPLDVCPNEEFRDNLLQAIIRINETLPADNDSNTIIKKVDNDIQNLPSIDEYNNILYNLNVCEKWKSRINLYANLISLLVKSYIEFCQLFSIRPDFMTDIEGQLEIQYYKSGADDNSLSTIKIEQDDEVNNIQTNKTFTIESIESDISVSLRWNKCWMLFNEHIRRLLADKETLHVKDPLKCFMLQIFEKF